MRLVLEDFQDEYVGQLLEEIRAAKGDANRRPQAVTLSAPTGSGKTVMMAAAMERLIDGDDVAPPNPAAVFLWIREKLSIDDHRWGRLCAEHALPLGWESMEYEEFLRERRRRMADIIRVAFRQLGGEQDAPPVTPPWFLPGAETVWQRIAETERALRTAVREVYVARFGDLAAARIEAVVPDGDRQTFARNLARRPAGSEPLSVVDYLYLGQLTPILFAPDVQQEARSRFSGAQDPKQRLLAAVGQIAPVRNEIAHVREIDPDRLLRASVACADVLDTLKGSQVRKDATNG